jgi:hypothetical protein
MVCRAGMNYSVDDVVNFRGQNWNGDIPFAPATLARPRDLQSLVELVAKATEDNQALHVVGSGRRGFIFVRGLTTLRATIWTSCPFPRCERGPIS